MRKLLFLGLFVCLHSFLYAEIRIMPVGDSITYDDSYADNGSNTRPASVRHAYRNYLWYKLRADYYKVNFVGSRVAGTAIRPPFDPDNEGYPGETSDFIGNIIYNRLVRFHPDIILLHIGTNDRWRISPSGSYMGGMRHIFDEIDRYENDYEHPVKVLVALIIGRKHNNFSSFTDNFNRNLRNLVRSRIQNGDKLILVDMQHDAGLDYDHDFRDPAHPTNLGYEKMAQLWYLYLKNILTEKEDFSWLVPVYGLLMN